MRSRDCSGTSVFVFSGIRFFKHCTPPLREGRDGSNLLSDLGYDSRADSLTALANSETLLFFQSYRVDQLDRQGNSVARHDHFRTFRKEYFPRHIRCADVELRFVTL